MKQINAYIARHKIEAVVRALHRILEVICRDELAEAVVEAIAKTAHTKLRNDGKIYVSTGEGAV